MKRIKLTATSKLNIALHLIPIVGFGYFAYDGGNTFWGGLTASLALVVLVDMVACIRARSKEKSGKR